jgi:hypothetical protein
VEKLDALKAARSALEKKITAENARHAEAIGRIKERIAVVDKEIFDLDEGRTLEAAKRAEKAHPEFAKLLLAMREQIELEEVARAEEREKNKGKGRGRPRKNQAEPNAEPASTPTARQKKG